MPIVHIVNGECELNLSFWKLELLHMFRFALHPISSYIFGKLLPPCKVEITPLSKPSFIQLDVKVTLQRGIHSFDFN